MSQGKSFGDLIRKAFRAAGQSLGISSNPKELSQPESQHANAEVVEAAIGPDSQSFESLLASVDPEPVQQLKPSARISVHAKPKVRKQGEDTSVPQVEKPTPGVKVKPTKKSKSRDRKDASKGDGRPDWLVALHAASPPPAKSLPKKAYISPYDGLPDNRARKIPAVVKAEPSNVEKYSLSVSSQSALRWHPGDVSAGSFLKLRGGNGLKQPSPSPDGSGRELVLGLDFGTSSVKVVIGDPALEMAFAVPFCELPGVAGFLLPSHIYQTDGSFSLVAGKVVHRNLKLDLIAEPDSEDKQERVVAFLAFIIRHARAWMMETYGAEYRNSDIFWSMRIGLPAANHQDTRLTKIFERIGRAAWILSTEPGDSFKVSAVNSALVRAGVRPVSGTVPAWDEALELIIVPEIAAQIFGYVSSEGFDPKALNIFLLVDVGAGTVDTSLFQVSKKRGKTHFLFFTSCVQPNGTMNLNRARLEWWLDVLRNSRDVSDSLLHDIESVISVTDSQTPLPDRVEDYISNSRLEFIDPKANPDRKFFFSRLSPQIKKDTFHKAWEDGHLTQNALKNLPTYLCGGGMRLPYYQKLVESLESQANFSWIKMQARKFAMPKKLRADGLPQSDYDRLSVAYGLSFMTVGSILQDLAHPVYRESYAPSWQDNYIDKDQV